MATIVPTSSHLLHKMKNWLKKWGDAEIVIGASIIAAVILLLVAGSLSGSTGSTISAWLSYYGHTLSGSLADFLYGAILFFCLIVILLVIWSLGKSFLVLVFPKLGDKRNKSDDPRRTFLATA